MLENINKNWLILAAALGVGGFAAYGTQSYIANKVEDIEARNKKQMVRVVVPVENLEKGTVLTYDNVAERDIPEEWAVTGAITPAQFKRAEGAVLAYPAGLGKALTWAQIVGEKAAVFSTKLDAGRRAVTVPVDEVSSISGMVQPDDLIDIVVSLKRDSRDYTFTLLQSVRVMATGTKVSQETKDANGRPVTFTTVTLNATPEEAKQLIAARQIGTVTAMLRAPGDMGEVSVDRTTASALLGLDFGEDGLSAVPVIYGGGPIENGLKLYSAKQEGLLNNTSYKTNRIGEEKPDSVAKKESISTSNKPFDSSLLN